MFDLRLEVSPIGILIFALPMLINIVYAFFPPVNAPKNSNKVNRTVEMCEQMTRILFTALICFLKSNKKINFQSPLMYTGLVVLILYYIVWIRYFTGGRDVALMRKSFLFVPIPLAVFPVIYYVLEALWVHNCPAAVVMAAFGVFHNIVSYASFNRERIIL